MCVLQSEIYEVLDCQCIDVGTDTDYNNESRNFSNRLTVVRDSDGTELTGSNGYYMFNKKGTPYGDNASYYREWNAPLCIEFDLVSTNTNGNGLYVNQSEDIVIDFNYFRGSSTDTVHIKITYDGELFEFYVDGVKSSYTYSATLSDFIIGFHTNYGATSSLKYKNFKIYPI